MAGSFSFGRGNNSAGFSISSNLSLQLPENSRANVVGSFTIETTYHDIRNSAMLNDYHRLRRWVSKSVRVCVRACVRACVCCVKV